MRKLYIIPLLFIPCFCPFSSGQEENQQDMETGISLFTVEMNGETLNHGLETKFVIGPYFNLYFSNLSWISNIEFGVNNIDDECETCADSYYGIGKLTELNVASGVRYTFLRERSGPFRPFVESDLYYSWSAYEGSFDGGYSGDGTLRDNIYNSVGILGRAGLSVYPSRSMSITLSSSFKFGFVKANYKLTASTDTFTGVTTITPLQLRLGYSF